MNPNKLTKKTKIYLRTFGLLGLLFFLTFVTIRVISNQIASQRNKLLTQLKKEQILEQKTELLRNLDTTLVTRADLTSFALPSQNSSFVTISQLKNLASENLISITNLKVGAETKEGNISGADIGFDAEGPMESVLLFLKRIGEVAPIILIDKAQLNDTGGISRATLKVKVFWADLPKTLPAISEPLNDLTNEEKEILVKIIELSPPDFSILEPEVPRENSNPF